MAKCYEGCGAGPGGRPLPDTSPPPSGLPRADLVARWRRWSVAFKRQRSSHVGAQDVLPFAQCLAWYLKNATALDNDDQALLKRWLDDGRASEMWSAIRAHAERHDGRIGLDAPIYFIILVLILKKAAEEESQKNVQMAALTIEVKKLKSQITRQGDRISKQLPFEKKARFWARTEKLLQACPNPVISSPRVRSDRDGSRARTYFIRNLSGSMRDTTGRWLDKEVAAITEIAFDMDDAISIETVRKARSK
jgi:hypothetical protein